MAVTAVLGQRADAAFDLVAAFALGRRHLISGNGGTGRPDLTGLEIILDGLAAGPAATPPAPEGKGSRHVQVFQSELWQLLHKVRESAELSYSRHLELVELDRRILFLLQGMGPLVPADVAGAVGVDKAQVSRSVKRMLELRMVERNQIRAPLRLTRKGEALAKRLLRLAELRNRELTFDIDDDELVGFCAVIEILLDRAMVLYDQERELAGRSDEPPAKSGDRRPAERLVIDRSRIISPLMTLSAYFSRSGALAYRRQTGLSNFEAFVLYEIGMTPPINWAALVAALERDQSQASRTVAALIEKGLVQRDGRPGRRHGLFAPTEDGARLYTVIHDAGRERSSFLLDPLDADRRARFLETFDKIRRNAVAQLARERAFSELDVE
ncbi:MAG: MarR family transcriptional regulator [Croceibacterium sp.]